MDEKQINMINLLAKNKFRINHISPKESLVRDGSISIDDATTLLTEYLFDEKFLKYLIYKCSKSDQYGIPFFSDMIEINAVYISFKIKESSDQQKYTSTTIPVISVFNPNALIIIDILSTQEKIRLILDYVDDTSTLDLTNVNKMNNLKQKLEYIQDLKLDKQNFVLYRTCVDSEHSHILFYKPKALFTRNDNVGDFVLRTNYDNFRTMIIGGQELSASFTTNDILTLLETKRSLMTPEEFSLLTMDILSSL